ncbi:hypothetical protein GWL_06050 [Herbaspirillum sp. GW103]|jgi:3-hydroxyisobutyrate dehydrogenase-like beta-hydroxyacid dehydrogenase|uniref:hypothetical protein n=1 Tax=unclassified Herbaspirillum TaxID=2624150 RepID=UPI00025E2A74|nr:MULTISPECIES: hypothetical protein [unclassified Herbaspirillum]EIJ48571.1 hypothetical protein GWL_06050 [Herbaspirillum sp. GW103]NUT63692.1 hypothetical protein [Herbaspirillum sp. C9C3]
MNNKLLASTLPAFLAALTMLCAGTTHAAEEDVSQSDPPRWYQEDNSPQQRLDNLNKETAAAYAQAKKECLKLKGKEAAACRQQAAEARKQDTARALRIFNDYKAAQPETTPTKPAAHSHSRKRAAR